MRATTRPALKAAYALVGAALLVLAAQLIGQFQLAGRAWPPLTDVVSYVMTPGGASLLWRNTLVTLSSAAQGFVFGALVAVLGAALALVVLAVFAAIERVLVPRGLRLR